MDPCQNMHSIIEWVRFSHGQIQRQDWAKGFPVSGNHAIAVESIFDECH
jgi:hypothetical protein